MTTVCQAVIRLERRRESSRRKGGPWGLPLYIRQYLLRKCGSTKITEADRETKRKRQQRLGSCGIGPKAGPGRGLGWQVRMPELAMAWTRDLPIMIGSLVWTTTQGTKYRKRGSWLYGCSRRRVSSKHWGSRFDKVILQSFANCSRCSSATR